MKENTTLSKQSGTQHANETSQESQVYIKDNRQESAELFEMKELIRNSSRTIVQREAFAGVIDESTSSSPSSNQTGMPNDLKAGIENLSGIDLSDVKVHYNSDKPAQLQAHAYTQWTDIHLGPGQEKHLPHEAWHVVQQKQGRVKPTIQMRGKVNVNDDVGLEKEADVMGARALSVFRKPNDHTSLPVTQNKSMVIQMVRIVPVNNGMQFIDLDDKQGTIYDPRDTGDLQKLVEFFMVMDEPLPQTIEDALELAKSIMPGSLPFAKDNFSQAPSQQASSVQQQVDVRRIIHRFVPYPNDPITALNQIEVQLKQLEPFLVPPGEMYIDDDPILAILSLGFATMLENVRNNKVLTSFFNSFPALQINGVSSKRNFLDYLNDGRTNCAQAIQGEMDEWFRMFNEAKQLLSE